MLASSVYSIAAYREMDRMLARERVDVVHLHNLVPFVTGAAYDACRSHGVPTVQHLRNYRAFCLSSYAFRDGRPCDDCVRTASWPARLIAVTAAPRSQAQVWS